MQRILPVVLALGLSGCASVNPEPAWLDVNQRISERGAASAEWIRTPDQASAAAKTVAELLVGELTVEHAVRIALVNNPSLQATFEEIGISQAELAQAGLLTNPTIGGSLRFPNRAGASTSIELSLVQNLLDLIVRPARKRLGAAQLEQTKLRVGSQALQLVADVKTAHYTLQARAQMASRLRLVLEIAEAAADFAERQHEAGNIGDLELQNHQAAKNQAKAELAMEESHLRRDREPLNRLLGLQGPATRWRIADRLPEIPVADVAAGDLETLALEQRLDLAAARWGVDIVGRALALKKKTRYFPVGIDVGIEAERDVDGTRSIGPSLALQLPIFDTGKAQIAQLEAQERRARRQLEALSIDSRSEVREARERVSAARELARFHRDVLLPQRVAILDLSLRHYNMMLKGVYDVLLAKQQEVAGERAYVEAWRDYWLAVTELERAVGGRLPEGGQ